MNEQQVAAHVGVLKAYRILVLTLEGEDKTAIQNKIEYLEKKALIGGYYQLSL